MLHLVTQEDLGRLLDCAKLPDGTPKHGLAIRRATELFTDIIYRYLPQPRAYLIEPTYRPDRERETAMWEVGNDLLTADLNDQRISVIDPASLRALIMFCPAFHHLREGTDPLWLNLVVAGVIGQVYIPEDGTNNKRHTQARERAKSRSIEVHDWHLAWGLQSRPPHP